VELDRVTVALRPRNAWESLDLGFQMAREWWRPIWGVWLSLYLPAAAILLFAFDNKFHAVLLLWWLKPAFDRAVLHAASRAVFGERIGVAATLRAWREWLWSGLAGGLTLGRLDLARSFSMPVSTLERQRGSAARKRRSALAARTRGTAVWLTVVCYHVEVVAMFALVAIVGMLEPTAADMVPDEAYDDELLDALRQFLQWNLQDAVYYGLAVCLVEPFYVTAGFALYLNRRTILEGWDIELQLRRMEERLRGAAAAAMLALAIGLGFAWAPAPAQAQDASPARDLAPAPAAQGPAKAPKSAQQEIGEVLKGAEFGTEREVRRWRYVGAMPRPQAPPGTGAPSNFLGNLMLFLADVSQGVLWVLAGIALALVLYALYRFMPAREPGGPRYRPPDTLFGLDVAPESLPDDVAAAALAAARAGNPRGALSLLYRGALSALVHRYEVALRAGDTEGDCVRAAATRLPEEGSRYFRELIAAWQDAAYAARSPAAERIEALCAGWARHFSTGTAP
jgi:hypothetical protein